MPHTATWHFIICVLWKRTQGLSFSYAVNSDTQLLKERSAIAQTVCGYCNLYFCNISMCFSVKLLAYLCCHLNLSPIFSCVIIFICLFPQRGVFTSASRHWCNKNEHHKSSVLFTVNILLSSSL